MHLANIARFFDKNNPSWHHTLSVSSSHHKFKRTINTPEERTKRTLDEKVQSELNFFIISNDDDHMTDIDTRYPHARSHVSSSNGTINEEKASGEADDVSLSG